MKQTTLAYIEKGDDVLLLYRNKKKEDENAGKWIGVGGKFIDGESPEECFIREVGEETGLIPLSYRYRGIVTFVSDKWETEYMHLFTVSSFKGELSACDEGTLKWIPKVGMMSLPMWEGDRVFLETLESSNDFFSIKLTYEGEKLIGIEKHVYPAE